LTSSFPGGTPVPPILLEFSQRGYFLVGRGENDVVLKGCRNGSKTDWDGHKPSANHQPLENPGAK
jgi:hypothetical protein